MRKPSRLVASRKSPVSASRGAKATACTTMSSPPHSLLRRSKAASICASTVTSSGSVELRAERLRERLDALLQLVVDVGERELGALAVQRLRDAPGDRAIGGDAYDEGAFAGEKSHGVASRGGLCRKGAAAGLKLQGAAESAVAGAEMDAQLLPGVNA